MALDTIIDKAQFEAALTASANAIREKTGDTALIEWAADKGFAAAIAAIEAGGGGVETGTFCPTEFMAVRNNDYVVSHSLGVVPSFIVLWQDEIIGVTDSRTANEIFCIVARPTRQFCAYQGSNASYSSALYIMAADCDWATNTSFSTKPRANIGYVTETSFSVGATVLSVGLDAVNYRWAVVA